VLLTGGLREAQGTLRTWLGVSANDFDQKYADVR